MKPSAARYARTLCGHLICASPLPPAHPTPGKEELTSPSFHSLTSCGHTFCQGCLSDWFSTTLAQHRQSGGRGLPPYTCPSCRFPVRTPPIQNFSFKRVVRLAAESRGESSPRKPPVPPPPVPPPRGRGPRRDHPSGPFDVFFWR